MKYLNKFFLIVLVPFGLLSGQFVIAQEEDVLRQLRDREEIEHLMWRYTRALDSFNPEAYIAIFTEDGSFGQVKGQEALKQMIVNFKTGRKEAAANGNPHAAMFHATGNSWLEFISPDHARHHAYWTTYFAANGPDSPARLVSVGRSVDDLVRVNGQWLIQSRNVTLGD